MLDSFTRQMNRKLFWADLINHWWLITLTAIFLASVWLNL